MDFDTDIAIKIFKLNLPWSRISPNSITFIGLISSLLFGYFLLFENRSLENLFLIGFFLFFRIIADIMDGFIARKFNKTSVIGNQLDTISDFIFQLFLYFFILTKIFHFNPKISITLIITYFLFTVYYFQLTINHNQLKSSNNNNFYTKFVQFTSNNSFLLAIIYFLIIIFYKK